MTLNDVVDESLRPTTAAVPVLHAVPSLAGGAEPAVGHADRVTGLAGEPVVDRAAAVDAVAALLRALGRPVTSPHLADTPRRVVDAYLEMLTPAPFHLTTFANDEGFSDLVLVRDVAFRSVCAHHLLPFAGVAQIGYVPRDRIVGLSKLARVLHALAADLQVQERLTQQVVDLLTAELAPRAVGVVLEADHQCMSVRGVRATGTRTTTTAFSGTYATDPLARAEFLTLALRRS